MAIFVNLPVQDVGRSRQFFADLGFDIDERFSNDTAIAVCLDDQNRAMLLSHAFFQTFTPRAIADATRTTEVLVALSCPSRAAVDAIHAAALAHGGAAVRPAEDHGFMYAHAFADPDGHIWEPFWFDQTTVGPQNG